jgi:hypothetical protein
VAAELDYSASDGNWLLPMVEAVGSSLGQLPGLGLAGGGYRTEENLKGSPIELVVGLGREGKRHAQINPQTHPYTATMSAKRQTRAGKAAYRERKWIAEPPNGWIRCWASGSSACADCTRCKRSGSSCAQR